MITTYEDSLEDAIELVSLKDIDQSLWFIQSIKPKVWDTDRKKNKKNILIYLKHI